MRKYLLENTERAIVSFLESTLAHDTVHPDKNVCGGIGGCGLMMHQHKTKERVQDLLEELAHENENFTLNVVRR